MFGGKLEWITFHGEIFSSEKYNLRFDTEKKIQNPIIKTGHITDKRNFTHVKDIVDGLKLIAFSNEDNDDAWELGTGINYSVNEVFSYFKNKFNVKALNIPDQPGNYRETLRKNDDTLKVLNWKPKDRLKEHINQL